MNFMRLFPMRRRLNSFLVGLFAATALASCDIASAPLDPPISTSISDAEGEPHPRAGWQPSSANSALSASFSFSGTQVTTSVTTGIRILILVDAAGAGTNSLVSVLTATGHLVTARPAPEYTFDGTNPSLADFDVVIHLNGATYWAPLPAAGQAALQTFVNDGGGYIGFQWLGFERANGLQTGMPDLVLQTWNTGVGNENCSGCTVTYTATSEGATHPLLAGLPSSFSIPADGHDAATPVTYASNPSTVLARVASGGAGILVREYGVGRVVNFSIAPNYVTQNSLQNAHVQRLIENAVWWVAKKNPNHPPTASPGGPYAGSEGSSVTLDLTGSDPDGDALTYGWDFGDGTTGNGATPPSSHTYADNGVYTILLTVDDGKGGTDTQSTTATIANVAPKVTVSGPAAVLLTGVAQISVSFTDPGILDTHTATINCGNGAGAQSLGTVTSPFQHGCSYSTVGNKTVTVTVTDKDGGHDTKTVTLSINYDFVGFSNPVANPEVMNVAKAGQTIPLKWRLLDANGAPVTNLSSASVTVASLSCTLGTTEDAVEEYASGSSGLQNLGNGYYQFNWKTPSNYANSCKTMRLSVGESSTRNALFRFTR